MLGQTITFEGTAATGTLSASDYRRINLRSGTAELYYGTDFTIYLEEYDEGTSEWRFRESRVFTGEDAKTYASVNINQSTGTIAFNRELIDLLNTERVDANGDYKTHMVGNTPVSNIRVVITPAIEPDLQGDGEFPGGNVSIQALNAALKRRDLQDIFARRFALRGETGEPGRRGYIPQLVAETYVASGETEVRILIKLQGWVGGEGETPTEYVGQYLTMVTQDNPDGFTTNRDVASNFRGTMGEQGLQGQPGDRGQTGYNPEFRIVNDGDRRVIQLSNWGLPQGETASGRLPTGVGQYLGTSGLTSDIASAVNIKGADGTDGSDGTHGNDGSDGNTGPRGYQGRYAVRVYVALTEAERTVNGQVRTPTKPTATGYDPATHTVQGLSSNPAWSTEFPAGDEVTRDNKDVFESFATYDPAGNGGMGSLTTFTTPFLVENERGPSGAAGADGDNGWTPEITSFAQPEMTDAIEAATLPLSADDGSEVHLGQFFTGRGYRNARVIPSTYGGNAVNLNDIPASLPNGDTPRTEIISIGGGGLDLSDAYNDPYTLQLDCVRTRDGNTANITMHALIRGDNLTFIASHQDIAANAGVTMSLTVDGIDYGTASSVASNSDTVYSQITGRGLTATEWNFPDNTGDNRASIANIIHNRYFHRLKLTMDGGAGTTYTLTLKQKAVAPRTLANRGTVILIQRMVGGTGVRPSVGRIGLYLSRFGPTPFIERASTVIGPTGDQGPRGPTGFRGDYQMNLYTAAATRPSAVGTQSLLISEILNPRGETFTIGSTIWHTFPVTASAGEGIYVASGIVSGERLAEAASRQDDRINVNFESPVLFSGARGEKGDQGEQGPAGMDGQDGASNPTAPGRNFIINGGMTIDQREEGQSALFVAASEGTISRKWVKDRWSLALPWNDQGITVSTEKTNATRSRRALKLTTVSGPRLVASRIPWTAGSSRNIPLTPTGAVTLTTTLSQEAAFKAGWGITGASALQLSFMFKSPTANTNYTIQLIDHSAGANSNKLISFRSGATANTWERHTVSIGGRTTGDAVDVDNINNKGLEIQFRLFETEQYTEATGTAADGAWTGSAADLATLNDGEGYREVRFNPTDLVAGVEAIGDSWEISDVQLEKNTGATEFEIESYDVMLEKCRKYFTRENCYLEKVYSSDAGDAVSEWLYAATVGQGRGSSVSVEVDDALYAVLFDFTAPAGLRLENPRVGASSQEFINSDNAHNLTRTSNNPFSFSGALAATGATINALSTRSWGKVTVACFSDDDGTGTLGYGDAKGPLLDFDAEFDA